MSKAINLTLGEEQVYPMPYMPIGTIYMNRHNVDPSKLFGGEWERLEDMFLIGASELYPAGTTGGEKEVTLKVEEMPSHSHRFGPKWQAGRTNGPLWTYNADDWSGTHYTEAVGGNKAHNNMPPYKAVYIWERVA